MLAPCAVAVRRLASALTALIVLTLPVEALADWSGVYQRAVQQLQAGDRDEATREFEALWKANASDAALANAIGAAMDSVGDRQDAVHWYNRALSLNPSFVSAYNNLGINYASRGMIQEALRPLRKACDLDSSNGRAFYNLGIVLVQLGRYSEAVAPLQRAHELSPQAADPIARLAYASFRAGRIGEGRAALGELLRAEGDPRALFATALKTLNDVHRYEDTLTFAREGNQDSLEVRLQMADALLALHRYDELVGLLRGKLRDNGPAKGYLLLGSAQALRGKLDEAVTALQHAVQLEPSNPDPYYRLGLVFLAGYREADAQHVMEQGLQVAPRSTQLLNGLAAVLDVAGNKVGAVHALRQSVGIDPLQGDAWGSLGDLYAQTGDAVQALDSYAQSIKLGAPSEIYAGYADYLIGLGRLSNANRVVAQGIARYPHSGELSYELGKLHYHSGRLSEAEKALRHAISLHYDEGAVHYLLAKVLQDSRRPEEAAAEFQLTRTLKQEARERKILRTRLIPMAESTAVSGTRSSPGTF